MKRLRETESALAKLTGETIRFVEKSGTTVKQLLIRSSIWPSPCPKPQECLLHNSPGNDKVSCVQNNFSYLIECCSCLMDIKAEKDTVLWNELPFPPADVVVDKAKEKKEGDQQEEEQDKRIMRSLYAGESHRAPILRLQEHVALYESKDSKSFMYKHWQSVHRDDKEKPKFKAKVVRFHQKSLVRQLEEAVIIWSLSRGPGPGDPPGPGIRIMNSKGMYNRCSIKRLVLEDSESKAQNEFPRKENDKIEVNVLDADETNTKLPSMIDSNSTSNKHISKVKTKAKPSVQTTDKQTKQSAEVITHYFKTK